MAQTFNPWESGFHDKLYDVYKTFRENDPVHRAMVREDGQARWFLFRHADVDFILKDARFLREWRHVWADEGGTDPNEDAPSGLVPEEGATEPPLASFWDMASEWMLFRDPPDHTRLRKLVNKAFTRRVVDGLTERINNVSEQLLQPMLKNGGGDLMSEYAFPLPVIVIAEMLGVPAEDREGFKRWSNAMAAAMDMDSTEEISQTATEATLEISEYLTHIIDERRQDPGEDLLSALIAAREKEDRLSERELVAMAILLLVAGHETTVNLIGNGSLALLNDADQAALLKNDPSLHHSAVEELLRYDAPVQMTSRFAGEDIQIGDRMIKRGDEVGVMIGSANRDPEVFDHPERLDITRKTNRHLSFGGGIHYCVGAPLARAEGQIALSRLFGSEYNVVTADGDPIWRPGVVFRGLARLNIAFT